ATQYEFQDFETPAHRAQHVSVCGFYILEGHFRTARTSQPHEAIGLSDHHTLALVHNEYGNRPCPSLGRVGDSRHEENTGSPRATDPQLGPVDDPFITLANSPGINAGRIRTRSGFRKTECRVRLARRQTGQIALTLLVRPGKTDGCSRRAGSQVKGHPARAMAERFHGDARSELA